MSAEAYTDAEDATPENVVMPGSLVAGTVLSRHTLADAAEYEAVEDMAETFAGTLAASGVDEAETFYEELQDGAYRPGTVDVVDEGALDSYWNVMDHARDALAPYINDLADEDVDDSMAAFLYSEDIEDFYRDIMFDTSLEEDLYVMDEETFEDDETRQETIAGRRSKVLDMLEQPGQYAILSETIQAATDAVRERVDELADAYDVDVPSPADDPMDDDPFDPVDDPVDPDDPLDPDGAGEDGAGIWEGFDGLKIKSPGQYEVDAQGERTDIAQYGPNDNITYTIEVDDLPDNDGYGYDLELRLINDGDGVLATEETHIYPSAEGGKQFYSSGDAGLRPFDLSLPEFSHLKYERDVADLRMEARLLDRDGQARGHDMSYFNQDWTSDEDDGGDAFGAFTSILTTVAGITLAHVGAKKIGGTLMDFAPGGGSSSS